MNNEELTNEEAETTETNVSQPQVRTRSTSGQKKPTEVLPSDRLAIDKQIDAIRAYAAAVESTGGPVDNKQAASILNLSENSIVVTNPFFVDVGILTRVGNGLFDVTQPVKDYVQALEWGQENPGRKLKSLFTPKWFTKTLLPRLKFKEMTTQDAVHALSEACGASKAYKTHLERVLFFMEFAGLCRIEGQMIFAVTDGDPVEAAPPLHNLAPPPPVREIPVGDHIPTDAPFLFLDKKRERKVTLIAPDSLTSSEVNKIKSWLELVLYVEEDKI